ncbi:hypothetical protein [Tabrizicola sp.]|uniref:hypothetical protein n=1 Tax=Tabrizicola sp. TaxID=2005166 RepID=UPI003F35416D
MLRFGPVRGGFCAICAVLTPLSGFAQDGGLRLVFGIENRLEVTRNADLSVPATGTEVANVTQLTFGLISETALDRLEFSATGAAIIENADGSSGTEVDFGRSALNFAYSREVPAAILEIAAEFRSDDVEAFADDLADTDEVGRRTDYSLSARLEVGRTSSVGFAFGVAFEETDFRDTTSTDLIDTREARGDVAVIFNFSEVATGRLGLRFRQREEDDTANTTTEETVVFAGLDYSVSERLDLGLELGYTDTETEEFGVVDRDRGPDALINLTYDMPVGTASALLRVTTDADEGQRETFELGRIFETPVDAVEARLGITHADATGTDLIGSLRWSRALPDGSIGLDIERRVSFDTDDSEEVTASVFSLSWTKDVNEVSGILLDATYELSDAASERIEQVTLGATYTRQLTQDWGLSGGLNYRVRNDGDGRSESPGVFIALSRDFEIRP